MNLKDLLNVDSFILVNPLTGEALESLESNVLLGSLEEIIANAGVDGDPNKGTSGSDTYNSTESTESTTINAGGGSDLIEGSQYDDSLSGNGWRDVIIGNDGADLIKGDGDDDVVIGSSGNDNVLGQGGDDHLISQLSNNLNGESDFYDGGAGDDTLWLALTYGEYQTYQSEIVAFQQWLDTNPDSSEQYTLTFGTSTLTVQGIETLQVLLTNTTTATLSGDVSGSLTEDFTLTEDNNLTVSGTLFIDDSDNLDGYFQAEVINGIYGTLSIGANGDWTYSADNSQTAIQSLSKGDSLNDTFTVRSLDGTTQNITITINGIDDFSTSLSTPSQSFSIDGTDNNTNIQVIADNGSFTTASIANISQIATGQQIEQANLAFANVLEANSEEFLNLQETSFIGFEIDTQGNNIVVVTLDYSNNPIDANAYIKLNKQGEFKIFPNAEFIRNEVGLVTQIKLTLTDNDEFDLDDRVGFIKDPGFALKLRKVSEDGTSITKAFAVRGNLGIDKKDPNLSFAIITNPTEGIVINNGDGTFTFNPSSDFQYLGEKDTRIVTFTYTVTDSNGNTSPEIPVTILVTGVNDVAIIDGDLTGEVLQNSNPDTLIINGQLTIDDPDIGEASFNSDTEVGIYGTFTVDSNGAWTYSADNNQVAVQDLAFEEVLSEIFTVTSIDGTEQQVTVSIIGNNNAPAISSAVTATATEDDVSFGVNLLEGASDVDVNDVLSVDGASLTLISGDASGVTVNGNSLTINPDAYNYLAVGEQAIITYSYNIVDGNSGVVAQTATITIDGANDIPVVSSAVNQTTDEDLAITLTQADLLFNASDIDGDSLTATNLVVTSGNVSVTDNGDGTYTITPDANWNGIATLNYEVSDGTETVSTNLNLTVNPINDAPVVSGEINQTTDEDVAVTLTQADLLANASDIDGDNLTASNLVVSSGNVSITNNGDGTYTITPDANWNGVATVSYDVSDGTETVSTNLNLTVNSVNDAPVVSGDINQVTDEDVAITVTQAELLANASDIDGDSITASNLVVTSGNISVTDNLDGTYTINPDANWNGVATVSYEISDGTETVSTNLNLTVNPVNDTPVVSAEINQTTDEDVPITITQAQLLANATDLDSDNLTAINLTGSENVSVTDNGDGTYTINSDANWNGVATVSYDVSDGIETVSTNLNLTVNPVNDAPVVSGEINQTTDEDTAIILSQSDLLANVFDSDGDSLTASNLVVTSGDVSVTDNGDGTYTIAPNANWSGNTTLSYEVSDGTEIVSTNLNLTVNPVNDAPTLSPELIFDAALDFSVTDNPNGVWSYGSSFSLSDVSAFNPFSVSNSGDLSSWSSGSYPYIQNNTTNEPIIGYYDGRVNVVYNPDELVLHPSSSNSNGYAVVRWTTPESGDYSLDSLFQTLDQYAFSTPSVNVYVLLNGTQLYSDYVSGTFGSSNSSSPFVTDLSLVQGDIIDFAVGSPNDLFDDSTGLQVSLTKNAYTPVDGFEDTPYNFSETDLLANFVDADGDALSVENLTVTNGTLTNNGNGNWTFNPDANWSGNATLSYDVSDGTNIVSTSLNLTVNPVNDAPVVAVPLSDMEYEGRNATGTTYGTPAIDLLEGASDADGDSLTVDADSFQFISGNSAGITFDPINNQLLVDATNPAYSSLNNFETEDITYQYDIIDGNGGRVTQTGTVSIVGFTNDPIFNPDNGHYYQFITGNWLFDNALSEASNYTYNGIQGHLVTVTSDAENQFIVNNFANTSIPGENYFTWIAASDAQVEGEWRWVAGIDQGDQFWQGPYPEAGNEPDTETGGYAIEGTYNNWSYLEPDRVAGDENNFVRNGWGQFQDAAWLAPNSGEWGDTSSANQRAVKGFIVEYSPDEIVGTEGIDTLVGTDIAESIRGYAGDDSLTGGGSSDRFIFESGSGNDTITDFVVGEDLIVLKGITLGSITADPNDSNNSVLNFDSGDTVILQGVTGITDEMVLFA